MLHIVKVFRFSYDGEDLLVSAAGNYSLENAKIDAKNLVKKSKKKFKQDLLVYKGCEKVEYNDETKTHRVL